MTRKEGSDWWVDEMMQTGDVISLLMAVTHSMCIGVCI